MNKLYNTSNVVEALMNWYGENKRDLPWRRTKDTYKIWLSEVMLQQTQVETVVPYFQKWIRKYPSLMEAAEAEESELLKMWEGLGYYNRCRNFHKAIKIVANDNNGKIPHEISDFKNLPGVGDYVAAAVLSISHGKIYPALDGNIIRVLSRILRKKKISKYNRKIIHNHILKWMKYDHSGDINEALMDLGSSICRPNQAHCHKCPLIDYCRATLTGNPEVYPRSAIKKNPPQYNVVTGIIWKNDRFLIMLRENKKHLGGLWEFPGGKIKKGEFPKNALKREIMEECGLDVNIESTIGNFKHAYTHFSIQMTSFHCSVLNGSQINTEQKYEWINPSQIKKYAFPKANHKIFSLMKEQNWDV
ncbi:MAG: A/G-specific adenine glycosylase [Fidelibacterota bacterium]